MLHVCGIFQVGLGGAGVGLPLLPRGGPRPRARGLCEEPLQVSSAPGRLHNTPYLLLLQVDRVVTGLPPPAAPGAAG